MFYLLNLPRRYRYNQSYKYTDIEILKIYSYKKKPISLLKDILTLFIFKVTNITISSYYNESPQSDISMLISMYQKIFKAMYVI